MKKIPRSLYMCFEAKVMGESVICIKGHLLGHRSDGKIHIRQLARGDRLEFTVCQDCLDYEEVGPRLASEDRGWIGVPLPMEGV